MKDAITIRAIATLRLAEARTLANNGQPEGAFYLAGYAVELALKARITERLEMPWLFDESSTASADQFTGLGELRKLLKSHNILLLLAVAGLKPAYDRRKTQDKSFVKYKSLLEGWNEGIRYQLPGTKSVGDAQSFLTFLTGPNGFLQWIEKS